MTGENDAMTY